MIRPLWNRLCLLVLAVAAFVLMPQAPRAAGSDVVIYSTDVSNTQGNWSKVSDTSTAGGQMMSSADQGWSATDNALSGPSNYFEANFSASASTTYHVWLRMRAGSNSKWNDSVYVQFSDAVDQNGQAAYRIGSTSGLVVNLATDSSGGSLSGWGWMDHAYWTGQSPNVKFIGSGSHTIRVQTREDGAQVDEIVLSPSTYLSNAPGSPTADQNIVYKSSSSSGTSGAESPYWGSPVTLPGTIEAENFDNGGEGVGYHDTTSGNSGGQYRSTDVDIEASNNGGYDVGWAAAGEWLNYTVNPSSSGSYTVQLHVASPNGGSIHVGFNTPSNVWTSISVPATGGWQSWQTVSIPATLSAGTQQMTVWFDTGGVNLGSISVSSGSGTSGTSGSGSGSGSGSSSGTESPYGGSPAAIPGTIEAENFDNGGEGVGYHDTTSGNTGGAYRSTGVDIESASTGGYDVGWTAPNEWLNYTVNVPSAGTYTVQLLVASQSGGNLHVGFNSASNVWNSVSIPATGGWQSWKTVSTQVTLGAGTQQITIWFDTSGVNLNSITVASGGSSSSGSGSGSGSGGSGGTSTVNVAEWNIQINDGSETHARVAMDTLMSINPRPQIIVIEEAWTSLFNTYIDELQRQTGQTWHGAWAPMCDPGQWNGSSCNTTSFEGIGIFTSYDITSSGSMFFPFADCWESARPAVRAALNVNGTTLQVFGAHLQTGGCADDMTSRYESMGMLKSWASNFSGPQIAAGDFNADPDQIDTTSGMLPTFVDSWSVAGSGRGFTALGGTPTMKLDYWFEDNQGRANVQSTEVITWTGSISDHMPLRATFQIQ